MSIAWTQKDERSTLDPANNAELRYEYGWHDVRSGLTRILMGYGVLAIGWGLCIMLIVVSALELMKNQARPPLGFLWLLYCGLGLMSVVSLVGYGMIITGKWRCLIHAPERYGTRWLIFACMTCLLMGPAVNFISGFSGMDKKPDFRKGPDGIVAVKFSRLGIALQIAGGAIGTGSFVLFLLFLRGVARCFNDVVRAARISAFLTCVGLIIVGTIVFVWRAPHLAVKPPVLFGLAGAWLTIPVGYLFFLVSIRNCISEGLAQVRSPLDVR